jgi:hypothetical protein
MMVGEAAVAGGIVAVALGAFKLVQFVIARQSNGKSNGSNGKKSSVPPADHGPCREAVRELTVGIYPLTEAMQENIREQREFRGMFERWLAREEGRREAQNNMARTGEFPVVQPPR